MGIVVLLCIVGTLIFAWCEGCFDEHNHPPPPLVQKLPF